MSKFAVVAFILLCLVGCNGHNDDESKASKVVVRKFSCGIVIGDKFVPFKNKNGQSFRWNTAQPIKVHFDSKVPEFVAKATMDAFEKWSKKIGGQIRVEQTDESPNVQVLWDEAGKLPSSFIAYTSFISRDNLTISAASISFNAFSYTFHSGAPLGVGSLDTTTGKTACEIEGVALHEVGHALGLDHSLVLGPAMDQATMHPVIHSTSNSLHLDDIAGIRSTYGIGSTDTPLPPTMFELDKTMFLYKQLGLAFEYRENQFLNVPVELRGKSVCLVITGKTTLVFDTASRDYLGNILNNKLIKR